MDELRDSLIKLRTNLREVDDKTLREILYVMDLVKSEVLAEIGNRDAKRAYNRLIKKMKNPDV